MNKENQNPKQGIIDVWNKVAPKFSKTGPDYWGDFGERLVELSSIKEGGHILDIGMGRGASLFPAIKKIGNRGRVVGIDISEVMVKETHKEILEQNIKNAEVYNMDAESLNFNESSFDNIVCGFSIGAFLFSENKFSGVLQILKDGGQLGFSTWGVQNDQKWLTEIVNKYIQNNTSNEKTKNTISFNTVEGVKQTLIDAGFRKIKVHEEHTDVIYKNEEEWWQEMNSNFFSCIVEKIEELGTDKLESFKKDVFQGLKKFKKEDGLYFDMPVIYGFAEK